jgi:hypothetical protein
MEDYQTHRMMHWSYFTPPNCSLQSDGLIDELNVTRLEPRINEIHAYGTYTLGFHFYPESVLPMGAFFVDGVEYKASNYTLCPKYNVTFDDYFSKFEGFLKSKTYTNDFGESLSWYNETYVNGYDEVGSIGGSYLEMALKTYHWLKNVANMTLPIMQTMMGSNTDLENIVDIICYHNVGSEPDYVRNFRLNGKQVWIYSTGGPRFPSPTLSTACFQTQIRALAWECYIYNYSNYVIWETATDLNGRNGFGYQGVNGGTILYKTENGYTISARMEIVREGFEDYEYFKWLNFKYTSLKISNPTDTRIPIYASLLHRVTNLFEANLFQPNIDYREFGKLRIEIGNALSL